MPNLAHYMVAAGTLGTDSGRKMVADLSLALVAFVVDTSIHSGDSVDFDVVIVVVVVGVGANAAAIATVEAAAAAELFACQLFRNRSPVWIRVGLVDLMLLLPLMK